MGFSESNVTGADSSQTFNEYEMIQSGCGKEKIVVSRRAEHPVTKVRAE